MNADKTFWIGKDHNICEDFALAEVKDNFAYAIVSDGCSASPDVDFGARLLTICAKENICRWDLLRGDATRLGWKTIHDAKEITDRFSLLHPQCLDATLLVTWVQDKKLTAYLYGDGLLVIRKKSGQINTFHIHLTSGAPDYLSYSLDPQRMAAYNALKDNTKEITTTSGIEDCLIKTDLKPFEPFVQIKDIPVEDGDIVAVISDGINSFRKSDYTPIPWRELIDEFTGFKNFEGDFVLRRVSAFKRKCLKEGITHSDDISVAAILV